MAHQPFASAPFVVGGSEPVPAHPHIPAEEALCPVVSHDWVNAEYKHLVVDASPKALAVKPGQFFNLLCPSPDAGELWLRRPQSVYRIDRARGRIEFLYKCVGRGTYGLATLKHGDDLNMVGPLGVGFTVDPAWKHIVVLGRGVGLATLGADLPARRRERHRRDRDPQRAQPGLRDGGRPVRQGRRRHRRARHRRHERGGECRGDPAAPDCRRKRRRVLHLRLQPPVPADEAARQSSTASRARSPWSRSWPAGSAPVTCACAPSRSNGKQELRRVCIEGPVFDLQEALGW